MAKSGTLTVKVLGDAAGFKKSIGDVESRLGKLGSTAAKFGKIAALGAAAAVVGIAAIGVEAFGAIQRVERIGAQTDAVLKSTGGAAGVTRKDIDDLANSLEGLTSVEAEAITEGQNLLLTFTNVQNKAGEGNDVFDQATKTMVDMSVAMGTDMTSASMLVGKALNDPIKGMSALSKAGVQFTDDQKAAIKAMVESGDVMGAQKVILGELNTQFGGSAEALGSTFTGNVEKLKNSFGNLTEEIVARLMPVAERLMEWAARVLPGAFDTLSSVVSTVGGVITGAFAAVSDWWAANGPGIVDRVGELRDAIMGWIDDVRPAIESWVENVLGSVTEWWDENSSLIIGLAEDLRDGLEDAIDEIVDAVQFVVDEWDKFKVAVGVAVAIMIPHFVALAVAAQVNAAKTAAAWVVTQAAAITAAIVHSAQVVAMIAKWVALAAVAVAQAAIVAGAWLVSMAPIALVIAAVAGLVAAFIIHWGTIKKVVLTGVQFVVDSFLGMAESIVGAAASAFSWVPGIGPKLDEAKQAISNFRDSANATLDGIRNRQIIVDIIGRWNIPQPPTGVKGGGLAGVFDKGGEIPGPRGSAQLILAHGGETVLPTHKRPLSDFIREPNTASPTTINITNNYPTPESAVDVTTRSIQKAMFAMS